MEIERVPKRSIKKIFRNIWLFSVLAFAIALVLWILIAWIFKLPEFSGYAPLIIFSIIGFVGGVSFLIWVSILIFSNKPLRVVDILAGIVLAGWFMFTTESILNIFLYNNALDVKLGLLEILIPLVAFGAVCFIWIKTKRIFLKGVIIIALIASYLLGRQYALNNWKEYLKAASFFNDALALQKQIPSDTDLKTGVEIEKKYVDLFGKAANSKIAALPLKQKYFTDVYELEKEMLNVEEQLVSGTLVLSQDDYNKLLAQRDDKIKALQSNQLLPFWVAYFKVQ